MNYYKIVMSKSNSWGSPAVKNQLQRDYLSYKEALDVLKEWFEDEEPGSKVMGVDYYQVDNKIYEIVKMEVK